MSTELHTLPVPPATEVVLCDACWHAEAAHDVISRRYCAATMAGAVSRTCICAGQ